MAINVVLYVLYTIPTVVVDSLGAGDAFTSSLSNKLILIFVTVNMFVVMFAGVGGSDFSGLLSLGKTRAVNNGFTGSRSNGIRCRGPIITTVVSIC